MKVYIVCGGCFGDEHIIAVCKTKEQANDRVRIENQKCSGLNAYFEEWTVEERTDFLTMHQTLV